MSFSGVSFLFAYLPVLLLCYYVIPRLFGKRKITAENAVLLIGSIVFYAWGQGLVVLVLIGYWLFNHFIALKLDKDSRLKKPLLIVTVAVDLLGLFIYKYLNFVLDLISRISGLNIQPLIPVLPVGISFFTFLSLSYILDVYNGKVSASKDPLKTGLFITMFPTILSGPINRYENVEKVFDERKVSGEDFYNAVRKFLFGLIKKVLIADTLSIVADRIFEHVNAGYDTAVSLAWLGAIVYTLRIYYDFSGYSDMAIGLGRMFGFEIPENFNYPYISSSVKEFWRRWHISLSSWFKDYVYIPLGGSRRGNARTYINLFIVWLLTGIWHGAGLTFIVWGLMYFLVLSLERLTGCGVKWKLPKALGVLYTMIVVTVGWVIFRAPTLTDAYRFIRRMIGLNVSGLWDAHTTHYILNNVLLLVISIIFATPVMKKFDKCKWLTDLILSILFLISIVYMVKSGYSPFIYFSF